MVLRMSDLSEQTNQPGGLGADANPFEQGQGDPTGAGAVETPNVDGGRPEGDPAHPTDFGVSDPVDAAMASKQTVVNDAVAGETVMDGVGDGNDGPTGGAPREGEPDLPANDLEGEDIDLDDEKDVS
ncbi:MAG: hypothetical protein JWP30_1035 [Homoserinimonas sp.]|jgi:hypothetical protein|nr:hypothetical protein [Homoserinimonas sp.]